MNTPIRVKRDVFISHSNKNEETCRFVVRMLVQAGVEEDRIFCTAIPEIGIQGNDFPQEIVDCLESSKFNIILLSKDYVKSPACLNEAGVIWFRYRSKKSIPMFCLAEKAFKFPQARGFINSNVFEFFRLSEREKENSIRRLCENARAALNIKGQYKLSFV